MSHLVSILITLNPRAVCLSVSPWWCCGGPVACLYSSILQGNGCILPPVHTCTAAHLACSCFAQETTSTERAVCRCEPLIPAPSSSPSSDEGPRMLSTGGLWVLFQHLLLSLPTNVITGCWERGPYDSTPLSSFHSILPLPWILL